MTKQFPGSIINFAVNKQHPADVAELADALDLGSSALAWGFESLHPHQYKAPVFDRSLFFYKSGKKQKSIAIYKSSLAEIRPVVCKKYLSGNNCQNMLTIICNGAMINLIEQAKFSKENDAKL